MSPRTLFRSPVVWSRLFAAVLLLLSPLAGRAEDEEVLTIGKPRLQLKGPFEALNYLLFSPDGQILATGYANGHVQLWDARTGARRGDLGEDAAAVVVLAFAPDGRTLAVGHDDGALRLWDVASGKRRAALVEDRKLSTLAWSPDGKTLACGTLTGTIEFLDPKELASQRRLKAKHEAAVFGLAFTPDGKKLVSTGRDGRAFVFDRASGAVLSEHREGAFQRTLAGAQSGGSLWAVAIEARDLIVMDLVAGKARTIHPHRRIEGEGLAFHPRWPVLAIAEQQEPVRILNMLTGQVIMSFATGKDEVVAVAFAPDGRTLATGGTWGPVQLWSVPLAAFPVQVLRGHKTAIQAVAYSPDGRALASAAGDGVKLWDARRGVERLTLTADGVFRALAFTPDGTTLAGGGRHTVTLWDPVRGKQRRTLEGHAGVILALAFAPDNRTLAVGLSNGTLHLWDTVTGKQRNILKAHDGAIHAVAFSPDGKTLVSAGSDELVKLWDVASGTERARLKPQGSVEGLAICSDGQALLTGSNAGILTLWDLKTRKVLWSRKDLGEGVWRLALGAQGKFLLTANMERGPQLWDFDPARPIHDPAPLLTAREQGWVRGLAFAPDGRSVATAGRDRTVRIWGLNPSR